MNQVTCAGATVLDCGRHGDGTGWAVFDCDLERGKKMPKVLKKLNIYEPEREGRCYSRDSRPVILGAGEMHFIPSPERVVPADLRDFEVEIEFDKIIRFRWFRVNRHFNMRFCMQFSKKRQDGPENLSAYILRTGGARGSLRMLYEPYTPASMLSPKMRAAVA